MSVLSLDVLIYIILFYPWFFIWVKIGKWYDKKHPDKKNIEGHRYPGMNGTGYCMTHGELYSFLGFAASYVVLIFYLRKYLETLGLVELLTIRF